MRLYQRLDRVAHDPQDDTLLLTCSGGGACPEVWIGREGLYVSLSAAYGPLEMALRLRAADLVAGLSQLRATERLSVMRMVGTGQSNVELGLSTAGELLFRMTIVADATGHWAMNLVLVPDVRVRLYEWLGVQHST
jgi:hypothetical protein